MVILIGQYECTGSKSGISDGQFSIDWADERMNSYAIWKKGAWAWAEFRSQKEAYNFLLSEFNEIRKHEE